jgi:hypothetical protein
MTEDFFCSQAPHACVSAGFGAAAKASPLGAGANETVEKYSGTVSTFYDADSGIYSETYEPARQTPLGKFWRIERRLVSGSWQHAGFASSSASPGTGSGNITGGWRLFECAVMPLIYDPLKEREFAQMLLALNAPRRAVQVGPGLLVHGSADSKGLGVVHVRASRPSLYRDANR